MSNDRNYRRLSNIRSDNDYDRDNVSRVLNKSLSSNDIYFRDFYFVSSNSTDDYAGKLTNEKWKEFSFISDEFSDSYVSEFGVIHILQLESDIIEVIESGDTDYFLVIIFFTLIHDIYQHFSEDFVLIPEVSDMKKYLVAEIKDFQDSKSSKTRVSKITTSYQKFITKQLNKDREVKLTPTYIKKYISRYKKLITNIFNSK